MTIDPQPLSICTVCDEPLTKDERYRNEERSLDPADWTCTFCDMEYADNDGDE